MSIAARVERHEPFGSPSYRGSRGVGAFSYWYMLSGRGLTSVHRLESIEAEAPCRSPAPEQNTTLPNRSYGS